MPRRRPWAIVACAVASACNAAPQPAATDAGSDSPANSAAAVASSRVPAKPEASHDGLDPSAAEPSAPPTAAVELVAQARQLQRAVACGPDGEVPPRFDARIIDAHCAALEREYERYEQRWLRAAEPFLASVVPKPVPSVVVYPFGGGDLLTALATFPDASEYWTMSLEPAGDVRAIDTVSPSELGAALASMRELVARRLLVSFLSTKNLGRSSQGAFPTPLVLTLVALVVHGYEPTSLRYFALEEDGSIRYEATETRNVELRFRARGDAGGETKVLRHLAVNLDDPHLAKNTGLVALLRLRGRFAVMTKAASHLLWTEGFSTLRRLLLENMQWMISDVTGIPPRLAQASGFVQDAYGTYEAPDPYGPTEGRDVDDFMALFRAAKVRSLGFWYGYPDKDGHGVVVVTRR